MAVASVVKAFAFLGNLVALVFAVPLAAEAANVDVDVRNDCSEVSGTH